MASPHSPSRPRRPSLRRRAGIVARWPLGMALTFWRYLWRTTPLHRREEPGGEQDCEPPLDAGVDRTDLQRSDDGLPPLFHRRYGVRVADARLSAEQLLAQLVRRPDRVAPVEVAVFVKTRGQDGTMRVGDEYVVRMPGPWDGPVRVVRRSPTSFRLATMTGHLEAGQIEFRAADDGDLLTFEIESWATSGDWLSRLLYRRLHLAKEMQLHMWTHYCERIAKLAGGRLLDGVHIVTRRVDAPAPPPDRSA